MLIKGDQRAEICYGNSLIPHSDQSREPGDQLAGTNHHFDYMLSNPPFGVTWGGKDGYEREARRYKSTRYTAGMPRTNDGAYLFLQTMLAKMKPVDQGGSCIAIIFNGAPLSNGDCGSGESEIRRWILENDWLDAIVMLPDQLFYNTGIFTYIWLLTNNKRKSHKGKVMIIDARKQFDKEPKSFGNKRNRILDSHRQWIEDRYNNGLKKDNSDDNVKMFEEKDFAFHKVNVVFWQTDEKDKPAYITEKYEKKFTPANIKKEQDFYDSDLTFHIRLYSDNAKKELKFTLSPKDSFSKIYENEVKKAFTDEIEKITKGIIPAKGKNKAIKAFMNSLEVDAEFTHRHYVSDYEYIPYGGDIEEFLKREIGKEIICWKDSPQLGYEILPNKYFYKYKAPMSANKLLEEFWRLEKEAEAFLERIAEE
jgi:type I restriction enzyme M protein